MNRIRGFFARNSDKIEQMWADFPAMMVINFGFMAYIVGSVVKKAREKGDARRKKKYMDDLDVNDIKITDLVYLNVIRKLSDEQIEDLGTIILGLYGNSSPKTVANFLHFIKNRENGYKNTKFHRVVPDFLIQGGDIDGKGGYSVYGPQFPDENLYIPTFPGCLAMANRGPDSNASQFFITTQPTTALNGKHVVFGRIVGGMDVVEEISNTPINAAHQPTQTILIEDCGRIAKDNEEPEEEKAL